MRGIHADALNNFNRLALSILESVSIRDGRVGEKTEAVEKWDFVPDFQIGAEQIVPGSMRTWDTDQDGSKTAFFFQSGKSWVGLSGSSFGNIEKIASGVSRLGVYKGVLSQKYVIQKAENWIVERYCNADSDIDFMTYLEERALIDVKQRTVLAPIAKLMVSQEFDFGSVRVKPFSRGLFEELKLKCLSNPDTNDLDGLNKYLDDIKKAHLGYAVMEIKMYCESLMAVQVATNEVDRAVSLLGIYSGHCLSVNTKSLCKVYGSENFESYCFFDIHGPHAFNKISFACESSRVGLWRIDSKRLRGYQESHLDVISNLLKKEELNEFESRVLNSLFIYSRAAFTSDPMEKLVFTLSSLESFLLRDKSEPIQQNLSDRFAYFITRTPDYRKDLVRQIKYIYALRSDYLHHGLTKSENTELKNFFMQVFAFYYVVLSEIDRYSTKAEFFDFIDDLKYS